jgi:outer membrane protein assembly factor BamB
MKTYFQNALRYVFIFLISCIFLMLYFSKVPVNIVQASPEIEVTVNTSQHTVVTPLEKSFRLVITMENKDSVAHRVRTQPSENEPPGGHVLAPVGYYDLTPGQKVELVVVIEFSPAPDSQQEQIFDYTIDFEWEGGQEQISTTVNMSPMQDDTPDNQAATTLTVLDANTKKPITNYFIATTYQSGMESEKKVCKDSNGEYIIETLSGDYLEEAMQQYSIDHKYPGLILQVGAPGYQSYFDTNFLAEKNGEEEISLEPLSQVGEYTLSKSIETGFSIWWIKASDNEDFFAFSQGTHGGPDIKSPDTTLVTMTDNKGNTLWQNTTKGECWGLDISPDGNYVAAGCHSGDIYIWDKNGDTYLEHKNEHSHVRWVKFSPDSKYLISGPVEDTPEKAGLFDLSSKQLTYTIDIGSYLREARFSDDGETIYLASANGQMFAINKDDGEIIWAGSGGYYIPFILGFSKNQKTLVTAGKGRSFRALDLSSGEKIWESAVDQTITAGEVAENGSVIGNTVGGMAYGLDPEGAITWSRTYGGVGHNAVFYTKNGNYALFGGPNPTLFDADGNVLWQREPGKEIQMSGPVEVNTGAAYVTWVSSDGSLIILGGDDGNIDFYEGSVKERENNYSQYTGVGPGVNLERSSQTSSTNDENNNLLVFAGLAAGAVVIAASAIVVIVVIKKQKKTKGKISLDK